ncbi:Rhodanese-like protein [Beauveria brongniartii RCEF 3172]|uniref:Rhodanese-like protein n=1 Tax=Beauveria brongniartii RCEF 3172 TaxID=1081107 RepID=A0A166WA83_9HYPO|nr:Rhodanese-like protein [Beauveria brongniartii RCEF 3172]
MVGFVTAQKVRHSWINHQEIALVDVREEGPYSLSHPLFAISVPVSELQVKLPALVPRLSAPIVVYDDGEGYAQRAVSRILAIGYRDVAILEGGLSAYALVGEVYRDVNVPSKAFGELVEAIKHTPSMPAGEVDEVLKTEKDVVVLDARRFSEYHTMSIPHGLSCPGGELVYRIFEAAPSPTTRVFVNCAGRTRSILGTQSLVNAGVPNKVVAIRNGTIGWLLAGLELEQGKTLRVSEPSQESKRRAREHAIAWSNHVGVSFINFSKLVQLVTESGKRTLHLLDVRTPEEYAARHPPFFESAPGGQLVQATDEWIGVRGARVVLYDDDGTRAPMTASWLKQLGWEVYVLEESSTIPADLPAPERPLWSVPEFGLVTVDDLPKLADVVVVDLARSPSYHRGHIPGAWYASGPELARDLKTIERSSATIVLTSPDGTVAAANLADAQSAVSQEVVYLAGGTLAWAQTNGALETKCRWLSDPIDVYKRPYEGTENARGDMQGYLDWEYGLVAQLANDGVASFHVTDAAKDTVGIDASG